MKSKEIIKLHGIHWIINFKQWHKENFNTASKINGYYFTIFKEGLIQKAYKKPN